MLHVGKKQDFLHPIQWLSIRKERAWITTQENAAQPDELTCFVAFSQVHLVKENMIMRKTFHALQTFESGFYRKACMLNQR